MMNDAQTYIFVLWGDRFDEVTATIFVSELRDAGLLVKVVGLTVHQTEGERGLAIVPDLTLDQALPLASKTACVVIPTTSRWEDRFDNDPRFSEFCTQAMRSQARFVVGRSDHSERPIQKLCEAEITVYPTKENMVLFARRLAKDLL